ncbi:MAG: hypothetical protein ACFE9P_10150 [Candidatus Hermodarchaeota archaeon]
MVDWNLVAETALYYLQEFMEWFLSIPLYVQILVVIGIAAVLVLTAIGVYYLLKGVVYLIYYILKGVYLLLKSIGLLFYKLFKTIYYAISGKPCCSIEQKSVEQEVTPQLHNESEIKKKELLEEELDIVNPRAAYCTACGSEFSERMHQQLIERGIAYCALCGKGFKINMIEMEQY